MASVALNVNQLLGNTSGIDYTSLIQSIIAADSVQITNLQNSQLDLSDQSSAYGYVSTSLQNLQTALTGLGDVYSYRAKAATSSNTSVGTATASTTALASSLDIDIIRLASSSTLNSGAKVTDAPAGSATAGSVFGVTGSEYFTINNTQITITASTTMDQIASQIASAAGIASASYDSVTGKFSIASSSTSLVMGSGGDTSDFLTEAHLFNSNVTAGSVSSSLGIGRLDLNATIGSISNFGGISGNITSGGTLTINGVGITYATTDTLDMVLSKINNSSAGVIASYDSYSDQVILTNKNRGSVGISVADGDLASALKLTSTQSSLTLGSNTQFTVNGGSVRESSNSTLTATDLGVTGVTFAPLSVGETTVTVGADVTAIKKMITDFITQYNGTINLIESYVKIDTSATDVTSTTTANNGLLASDGTLTFLQSDLRQSLTLTKMPTSSSIKLLADLGIEGNDSDNTLSVTDSTKLEDAINDHLDELISLFTSTDSSAPGIFTQLNSKIEAYANTSTGVITNKQSSLTDEIGRIDDDIARAQSQIDDEQAYLEISFSRLASAQSTYSQWSSYLKQLSSNSSSS